MTAFTIGWAICFHAVDQPVKIDVVVRADQTSEFRLTRRESLQPRGWLVALSKSIRVASLGSPSRKPLSPLPLPGCEPFRLRRLGARDCRRQRGGLLNALPADARKRQAGASESKTMPGLARLATPRASKPIVKMLTIPGIIAPRHKAKEPNSDSSGNLRELQPGRSRDCGGYARTLCRHGLPIIGSLRPCCVVGR
jgi:hypothetical protein